MVQLFFIPAATPLAYLSLIVEGLSTTSAEKEAEKLGFLQKKLRENNHGENRKMKYNDCLFNNRWYCFRIEYKAVRNCKIFILVPTVSQKKCATVVKY